MAASQSVPPEKARSVWLTSAQPVALNGRIFRFAEALSAAGFSVGAVFPDEPGRLPASFRRLLSRQVRVPRWRPASGMAERAATFMNGVSFRLYARAFQAALGERASTVIAFDIDPLAAFRAEKLHERHALILDACEYFPETAVQSAASTRYIETMIAEMIPTMAGVSSINERIARLYMDRFNDFPETVLVRNSAHLFATRTRDTSPLRTAVGASVTDRIALFHGGLSVRRGLEDLIARGAELPEGWHLAVLGRGPLLGKLRAQALGLPRVHFLPTVPVEALPNWLVGADLGLIPYERGVLNHECASPNKLFEYPSVGVPVAVGDYGLIGATVRQHGIGYVLSPDRYAEELITLMQNWEDIPLHSEMRAFTKAHSWQDDAARLVSLVSRVSAFSADASRHSAKVS